MNDSQMLEMLKIDLGITTTHYDPRLKQYIKTAEDEIKREGVNDLAPSSSLADANLVLQYASWMWRRRDTGEGMPRMIRWLINNRLFDMES